MLFDRQSVTCISCTRLLQYMSNVIMCRNWCKKYLNDEINNDSPKLCVIVIAAILRY